MAEKHRYWWGVCYPENMIDGWQEEIERLIQLPYAYCIHNKDFDAVGDGRKEHVHLILIKQNTTTYKSMLNTFNRLSAPGKICCNKIEACMDVRYCYNYLIHDTDKCREKGKHLYPESERITGCNFDIGLYEQLGLEEIFQIRTEIGNLIIEHGHTNYMDLWEDIIRNYETKYEEILIRYSSHFDRLVKGNFNRKIGMKKYVGEDDGDFRNKHEDNRE